MDEMTQQNSALVEENAASAKTLEHQSAAMNEKVAFFMLDDDAAAPAPKVAEMPARRAAAPSPRQSRAAIPKDTPKAALKPAASAAAGRRGPVGRLQAAVATALADDQDWKEF
jgi:methyl-accepting chemotaxis protein